jgi:myo-inositol 2-dehydrogenase/D-chiro-inositol 1-dehydrogenase
VSTRVGIIGAGLMGSTHARLLGGRLAAVADPDTEAAARLGADILDPFDLIGAVDAVVVASPADTHEAYTLACLAAGKPVLCEKPLASSAEACLRIARADEQGLVTVGFMRRYDPAYVALRAELRAGTIGTPLLVHCAHRNPFVHEFFDSAMIITDSAVHEVDVTRWLLGEEVARVTVHAPHPTSLARSGVQDPQLIVLETASGKVVDVEAFVSAGYGYDIRCEIVGESGTLELPRALAASFQERFATAYQLELRGWLAGETGPSAWDGYAATAVCEAGVRALKTGQTVDVVMSPS